MKHILDIVYGFLVIMMLVAGAAVGQVWTQALNSLEGRVAERRKALVYSIQIEFFAVLFFSGGMLCLLVPFGANFKRNRPVVLHSG